MSKSVVYMINMFIDTCTENIVKISGTCIDTFKVTKVFPQLVPKGGTKFKENQSKMLGGVIKNLSPCQILPFENESIRRRIAKYIASLLQMARSSNLSFVNTTRFMSSHIHSFSLRGDNWIL